MMQWYGSSCRHRSTWQRQFLWTPGKRQPQLTAKGQLFSEKKKKKVFPSENRPVITCKHDKVEARTQRMTHKPPQGKPWFSWQRIRVTVSWCKVSSASWQPPGRRIWRELLRLSDLFVMSCTTVWAELQKHESGSATLPAQRFPAPANHRVRGQVG